MRRQGRSRSVGLPPTKTTELYYRQIGKVIGMQTAEGLSAVRPRVPTCDTEVKKGIAVEHETVLGRSELEVHFEARCDWEGNAEMRVAASTELSSPIRREGGRQADRWIRRWARRVIETNEGGRARPGETHLPADQPLRRILATSVFKGRTIALNDVCSPESGAP